MVLTEAETIRLKAATRDMAGAFVDDFRYLEKMAYCEQIEHDEIRRASNILRRIYIDKNGDLRKIAPPRIGAFRMPCVDLNTVYASLKGRDRDVFVAGGAKIFGKTIHGLHVMAEWLPPFNDYDVESRVALSMDGFLKQNVIYFRGQWFSRADIIKYIANIAHGVHSSSVRDAKNETLSLMRSRVGVWVANDPTIFVDINVMNNNNLEVMRKPGVLDALIVQLLECCQTTVNSSDLQSLVKLIDEEI